MGGSIEGVGWEIGGGTGLRGWMIGCELRMCWRIVCGVVSRSTLNVIAVVWSGQVREGWRESAVVREELVGRRESAHPSVQPWNLWRGVCTQGWEAEQRVVESW